MQSHLQLTECNQKHLSLIFWEVHFMEPTPWVHKKVAIKNLPKIRAQIHVDFTQNSPRMAMKN